MFKAEGKNTAWRKVHHHQSLPPTLFTLHALHGICHPSLPIHQAAEWVRQCMPIFSAHYVHECTRTRWEETTLIYFHRTEARRQRRARLDRESLGKWPYTPDSDNTGDGLHSQWAGEEALSLPISRSLHFLYQFWEEGNEPNQISSWLSITNGSDERRETLLKQALGEMIDSLSLSTTCLSLSPVSIFLSVSSCKPQIESHCATNTLLHYFPAASKTKFLPLLKSDLWAKNCVKIDFCLQGLHKKSMLAKMLCCHDIFTPNLSWNWTTMFNLVSFLRGYLIVLMKSVKSAIFRVKN